MERPSCRGLHKVELRANSTEFLWTMPVHMGQVILYMLQDTRVKLLQNCKNCPKNCAQKLRPKLRPEMRPKMRPEMLQECSTNFRP